MRQHGFTLLELFFALFILAIITSTALPALQRLLQDLRVQTTMWALMEATQVTRSYAIKANKRASMRANPSWQEGWQIFYDDNHNGELDEGEQVLTTHQGLPDDIFIEGNTPVARYVSYLGSGESRWATGTNRGGFQAGTITICPTQEGKGYELILARGGRVRKEDLEAAECSAKS